MRDNVILAFSIICSGSFFLSTDNTEPSHILLIKGNSDRVYPSNIIPASSDIIPTERHLPQSWFLIAAVVASLKMNLYLTGSSALFFWSTSSCLRVSDSSAPLRSSLFSFDNNAFFWAFKSSSLFFQTASSLLYLEYNCISCWYRGFINNLSTAVFRSPDSASVRKKRETGPRSVFSLQTSIRFWQTSETAPRADAATSPRGACVICWASITASRMSGGSALRGNSSQGWPNDIVTSLHTDIKALQFWLLIAKIAVKSIWGKNFCWFNG